MIRSSFRHLLYCPFIIAVLMVSFIMSYMAGSGDCGDCPNLGCMRCRRGPRHEQESRLGRIRNTAGRGMKATNRGQTFILEFYSEHKEAWQPIRMGPKTSSASVLPTVTRHGSYECTGTL